MVKMEAQCAQQPHMALETFQKWSQTILRPQQLAATFTPSQDLGQPYQTNRNAGSANEINGITALGATQSYQQWIGTPNKSPSNRMQEESCQGIPLAPQRVLLILGKQVQYFKGCSMFFRAEEKLALNLLSLLTRLDWSIKSKPSRLATGFSSTLLLGLVFPESQSGLKDAQKQPTKANTANKYFLFTKLDILSIICKIYIVPNCRHSIQM